MPEQDNVMLGWGTTRYHAEIVTDGDRVFVKIETHMLDQARLQVFLPKAVSAVIAVEAEVEGMSTEDVAERLRRIEAMWKYNQSHLNPPITPPCQTKTQP